MKNNTDLSVEAEVSNTDTDLSVDASKTNKEDESTSIL